MAERHLRCRGVTDFMVFVLLDVKRIRDDEFVNFLYSHLRQFVYLI